MGWVMASLGSFLILIPGWHILSLVEGRSLVPSDISFLCYVHGSVAGCWCVGGDRVPPLLYFLFCLYLNSDHLISFLCIECTSFFFI